MTLEALSDEQWSFIRRFLDNWLSYQRIINSIPGMSVGIVQGDNVAYNKSFGLADQGAQRRVEANTQYRIASISKIFTAIAIMKLIEDGALVLEDRVGKFLPWLDERSLRLTVRQLLTHSSGLSRDGETAHWIDSNFPDLPKLRLQAPRGLGSFESAKRFKYSNLGFALLGRVIEAASGLSYKNYMKQIILQTVGMPDTTVDFCPERARQLATGYGRVLTDHERIVFSHTRTKSMESATGFVSTVSDLCRFFSKVFFSEESLLSKESLREMQRVQWFDESTGNTIKWGLGLEIWRAYNTVLRGHNGVFLGFSAQASFDVDRKISVVVLTNGLNAPTANLANGIFNVINYVSANFGMVNKNFFPLHHFNRLEGLYTELWDDILVFNMNNQLSFIYPSARGPMENVNQLRHVKDTSFVFESGSGFDYIGEPVRFVLNDQGTVDYMTIGPNNLRPLRV